MFGVRIEGLDTKLYNIEGLRKDIASMKNAWERIARIAADRVSAHTPVRSGKLRSSTDHKSDDQYASARSGSPTVPYAGMVNYGFHRRYMQAADLEIIPMIEPILEAEIDTIIRKRRL